MKRVILLAAVATLATACTSVRTRFARFEPCDKPGAESICRNDDGTYSFRTPYGNPK